MRESMADFEEIAAAKKHFDVVFQRTEVPPNRLVIPRYYLVPHPKELEADINYLGSELINTTAQHRYIAGAYWTQDISNTPQTWFDASKLPEDGAFIVKGETNSKKFRWDTLLAPTKWDAIRLGSELGQDTGLAGQRIMYRRYVPLKDYGVDPISGVPIAHEFRVFFLIVANKPVVLTYGYYWSTAELEESPKLDPLGMRAATEAAWEIKDKAGRFFAIDVALTKENTWIVIEVNDGCQAGLSECSGVEMYKNLAIGLAADYVH